MENITNHNSRFTKRLSDTKNDFDFDGENCFENRPPFAIDTLAKMKKKISKALSLSQLYTSWQLECITVICKWPYLPCHSNEQSLISYNKRPTWEHLMECSSIISLTQSLSLRACSHYPGTTHYLGAAH